MEWRASIIQLNTKSKGELAGIIIFFIQHKVKKHKYFFHVDKSTRFFQDISNDWK